jgi:hypothetical protein
VVAAPPSTGNANSLNISLKYLAFYYFFSTFANDKRKLKLWL